MKKRKCMLWIFFLSIVLVGCSSHYNNIEVYSNQGTHLSILAGQSMVDAGTEDKIETIIYQTFPDVTLEWECVDWGTSFAARLRSRLAAGNIPDILIGKSQDISAYGRTGILAEIPKECVPEIKKECLKAVTIDDMVYGIPYTVCYQGVLYNKEIFEENHLSVPNTLEELSEIVDTLQQVGITPYAGHFQECWQVGNTTMQFLVNDLFINHQNWGSDFRLGKVDFTNSDIIKACLEYNKNILDHSWDDALMINQNESDIRFSEGEAAMYLTGSWSLQVVNHSKNATDVGIFPFPNQTGNSKLIMETNMTFMKSAQTDHSDLINQIFVNIVNITARRSRQSGVARATCPDQRSHLLIVTQPEQDLDHIPLSWKGLLMDRCSRC